MKYVVQTGDTFEIIARKRYGDENKVSLIIDSNPGVVEPLTEGISIVIPPNPTAPQIISTDTPSNSINEVALKIENERFRFWESITITRSIDTFDTLEFTSPFQADNKAFRNIFRPFSFQDVALTIGGKSLFKGTMLTPVPSLTADSKTVAVSGYSLPGVLNDCNMPASAFPLEFNGLGLEEIATRVAKFFGLAVEFTEDQGPIFERVAAEPDKKAFDFLIGLAQQRNFIISSTPEGKLLFHRSVDKGNPVARFEQGLAPIIGLTPKFKPQGYYSHVTGLQPSSIFGGGSAYTVKNPRLEGIIRPHTFKPNDTTDGNVKEAVDAKASRMFADIVSYDLPVPTWRDSKGELWIPNTTITLKAPGAMVYSEYEFLIRSVTLTKTVDSETASLNLVIPESFNGKIPERLPWEE